MMCCIWSLLIVWVCVGTINAADTSVLSTSTSVKRNTFVPDARFNPAIFTPAQRSMARAFILHMVNSLKSNAGQQLKQMVKEERSFAALTWKKALLAVSDSTYNVTQWEVNDEIEASMACQTIMRSEEWLRYIQRPKEVSLWASVHDLMLQHNYEALCFRHKVRRLYARHARQYDTIMFLTTFLLNQRYQQIGALRQRRQQNQKKSPLSALSEPECIAKQEQAVVNKRGVLGRIQAATVMLIALIMDIDQTR